MKVSYKVLKKYIPDIKSPEEIAQDLIMHTAEVEEIHESGKQLEKVFSGYISSYEKHPDADKLGVCQVEVLGETRQIVCGAPNARAGIKVCVALPGAELAPDFVIKKSKIRGVASEGMLCSEDELGLTDLRQDGIMELPEDTELGVCCKDLFAAGDTILEIDNKAINHRPDLFSHIGIAREIAAIDGKKLDYTLTRSEFNDLPELGIQNDIPQSVRRYMGLKMSGVQNIPSPEYVTDVLKSHEVESKGLLIDITNYSLYLYGQPTHCFDADKISGNIHIRFAKDGESFTALNDKEYSLSQSDIVIADEKNILALGGIIGGKDSAVSDSTSNIIIESAWFDQALIRKTGKRLGLRTDSLNVFEKDLVSSLTDMGVSLIRKELETQLPSAQLEAFTDVHPDPKGQTYIDYNHDYICRLLGKKYNKDQVLDILDRVFISEDNGVLTIPLWRKDLTNISDIAEEVARLDGYNNIEMTVPRIQLGAVSQSASYLAKRKIRNHLCSNSYYEMYTYSFVDATLMEKSLDTTEKLVPLKNALTEEMTHMRGDLIPNLLKALSENKRDFTSVKLFECEKVFHRNYNEVSENTCLAGLEQVSGDLAYYEIQNTLKNLLDILGVNKYSFEISKNLPSYAHSGRSAALVIRGKEVGSLGEIHPKAAKNFGLSGRVGYFSLNLDAMLPALFSIVKAEEISQFQANNFDINFAIDKSAAGKNIVSAISKSSPLIKKVELIDIYEDEEKLPGKRSLTFKVYIQSMEGTLDDSVKNEIIDDIIKRAEKVGASLR